jgi:hypothetical protein
MNRTLALFLTLVTLLAHTLAIHKDSIGEIAPPYDQAHVAYRLGRNFVESGSVAWDPGLPPGESYPSPLWVGVAAFAERIYLGVTSFCQLVGMLSALFAVLVLAQFSPVRLAGVIAPVLFVASGGIAAAAGSGMETAFFTLLVTASFLAFERRRPVLLGILLALTCATRPEGALFPLALFVLEVAGAVRARVPRRPLWWSFVPPALVSALIVAVRYSTLGHFLSPWTSSLLEIDVDRWKRGLVYLGDFALSSGWTILLVFPLWFGLRGRLTGTGRRALLLAVAWAAMIAAGGGGALPFFAALVPSFAILLIAIQESMTLALDSGRRGAPQLTWALFLCGLAASFLGSKYPGDLGQLKLERLHRAWMTPHSTPRFGYQQQLGRLGLAEEIDATQRLRSLGIFLRGQLDPQHTVLTPWPGAVGYLSRLRVIDMLGRTTPPPGHDRVLPWTGMPRADVLAALSQAPDYIVPMIAWRQPVPEARDIAANWARELDIDPDDPRRAPHIRDELRTYELITVPIPLGNSSAPDRPKRPFYLLRRKALGLAPVLSVELEGKQFRITVAHRAHEQLVDLRVLLRDAAGELHSMLPTGGFIDGSSACARRSIVLYPTGTRRIELAVGELPDNIDAVELRAVLRNPGARGEHSFAAVSEPRSIALR